MGRKKKAKVEEIKEIGDLSVDSQNKDIEADTQLTLPKPAKELKRRGKKKRPVDQEDEILVYPGVELYNHQEEAEPKTSGGPAFYQPPIIKDDTVPEGNFIVLKDGVPAAVLEGMAFFPTKRFPPSCMTREYALEVLKRCKEAWPNYEFEIMEVKDKTQIVKEKFERAYLDYPFETKVEGKKIEIEPEPGPAQVQAVKEEIILESLEEVPLEEPEEVPGPEPDEDEELENEELEDEEFEDEEFDDTEPIGEPIDKPEPESDLKPTPSKNEQESQKDLTQDLDDLWRD
jgi:hypothetical protein